MGPVVFFYAVDCKPEDKKVKAVEIQPKPRAIFAENTVADKVRNNTSEIVEIPDQNTWTGEPITGTLHTCFYKAKSFQEVMFFIIIFTYLKLSTQHSAG